MQRSLYYFGLHTLLKRLSSNCNQYPHIQNELKNVESGDYGEQYVTELLQTQFQHQVTVLSNIFIGSSQIDCIVLTPYFCVVLEVKNIKGHIAIRKAPRQMIREIDENKDVFQSPEVQLERSEIELNRLFAKHKIELPIFSAVLFPFHTSIIQNESKQYPVLMGKEVLNYIHLLPSTKMFINPAEVASILQKQSDPWHRFPLCDYYNINPSFLQTGVECRKCGTIPMLRTRRTWKCMRCGVTGRVAHVQAIREYYVLFSNVMTNRECVAFLHLRNRQEATRILKSIGLEREGVKRNSIYKLQL
ncbi:nuclease-related domain-containing protein [Lysinibacillus sp. LZ02]|uniref:nuclease-related domain-containing protein n=1 Tax=Lysinibacillus sp. LZ02 TaxID=3420668 RepID=UPI003D360171